VVCKDSGLADVLSTAIFNMPYEEGLSLIESIDGAEALWIYPDGSAEYTPGFGELIIKKY